jgi:hypothetical protein
LHKFIAGYSEDGYTPIWRTRAIYADGTEEVY